MFKKNNLASTQQNNSLPQITDEEVSVVIEEKGGKKIKKTKTETKVINKKNKDVLGFGDRKIKDFIAVDVDR